MCNVYTLCSLELVPQMDGGLGPSGFDTLKRSVRHWVKALTTTVPPGPTTPDFATRFATEAVNVFGPVITKFMKSSLSYKEKESNIWDNVLLWSLISHLADVVTAGANCGLAATCHDVFAVKVCAVFIWHASTGNGDLKSRFSKTRYSCAQYKKR